MHSDDGEEIEKEISERPTQEKQQLQRLIVVYEKPWFVQTSAQVDFTACDPSTCALSYDPSDLPSARAVVFDALRLDQTTPPSSPATPRTAVGAVFPGTAPQFSKGTKITCCLRRGEASSTSRGLIGATLTSSARTGPWCRRTATTVIGGGC